MKVKGAVRKKAEAPWQVCRAGDRPFALATTAEGSTVQGLADRIGLDAKAWRRWLRPDGDPEGPVRRAGGSEVSRERLTTWDALAEGQVFRVPNTVMMVWTGDLGWFGRWVVGWHRDRVYLQERGFHVEESITGAGTDEEAYGLLARFEAGTAEGTLHGLFVTGHGHSSLFGRRRTFLILYEEITDRLAYRLGLVVLNACNGGWSCREKGSEGCPTDFAVGGRDLVADSPGARFYGKKGLLIPQIVFVPNHTCHVRHLVKPGEQGTVA